MADHAGLAGHGDVVTDIDRAGQTDLGDEETVFADLGPVADRDQVAELCAGSDFGFAERGSVNRTVRADFNVTADSTLPICGF